MKNQKGALNSSENLKLQKAPLCRFHYYRVMKVPLKTSDGKIVERLVRRRGKALVHEVRVAATDEHGEYGRAQVVRRNPFTSSTTAGGVVCSRGNTDWFA